MKEVLLALLGVIVGSLMTLMLLTKQEEVAADSKCELLGGVLVKGRCIKAVEVK